MPGSLRLGTIAKQRDLHPCELLLMVGLLIWSLAMG